MELELVAKLRDTLPRHPRLEIGVGDDAALLAAPREGLVVTTDLLVDGVHFHSQEHTPERIGRKALAVNLSDLAAMAARPAGCVVSLALPREAPSGGDLVGYAARLIEGMLPLASRHDCPIAGGDTNIGPGPLVVSVTAFGEPTERGVLRRDSAQVGDWLLVTGSLGGSLSGKHLDFEPRVQEALWLREHGDLHAGMDLTDGLGIDARRLAEASGLGLVIDAAMIPISDDATRASGASGRSPLDHALGDGEDFELLFAAPPEAARDLLTKTELDCGVTRIGEFTAERGLFLRESDGARKPLPSVGYEHR